MKSTRLLCTILSLAFVMGMAACSSKTSETTTAKENETTTQTSEVTTTTTTVAESVERTPTGTCTSDKFNDFENMNFTYKGKKYTLGVTTLADMINDGVPFSNAEGDFGEKVDKQSSFYLGFSFDIIPYRSATVTVANYTDNDLPVKDCVISSFRLSSIRQLPDGGVTFNFPDLFTKDDVINSIGEPDGKSEFDSNGSHFVICTYEQVSEIYMGKRYYEYTFKDDIVDTINMSYIP